MQSLAPERPLTSGAAKITGKAADEPILNVEAAAENPMPKLQNDLKSSEISVPRS